MTSAQPQARPGRVAFASAIGTTIEWYDFFIYGTAAALVFGKQFFPGASDVAGTLASFATFAAGFVARPVGGVLFGHFGDRLGRKTMLVWSLLLMGTATFAIGLLPTYAQIGLWAPALLVVLRLLQGVGLGGEWGGAVLMSVEHAPDRRRGYFGGFVAMGLSAGIILANLAFLIVSATLTPAAFSSWGWRIPFLLSAVLVVVGLYVRLRVTESPVFDQALRADKAHRMPVVEVFRRDARTVLLAAGTYLIIPAMGYVVQVYFITYAVTVLNLPRTQLLLFVVVAAVVQAVVTMVSASLSDRIGRRRVMLGGLSTTLICSLAFFPLAETGSLFMAGIAMILAVGVLGVYNGPQPAVFAELFDTRTRYSGVSLSLQIGTVFGGALVPFVATWLYAVTETTASVTAYLAVLAVISLLCALKLKETYQQRLTSVGLLHAAT